MTTVSALSTAQDTRYRLQSAWTWREDDDGVELYSLGSQRRLRIRTGTSGVRLPLLLHALSEWRSGSELAAMSGRAGRSELDNVLARLVEAEVLVSAPSELPAAVEASDGFFDRQMRFLALFEATGRSAEEMHERLRHARVLLVGAGGWGTWTLLLLARIGVGEVVVFDDDTIEQSNLNRQVLYGVDDVGRLKVDAARDRIERDTAGRTQVVAVPRSVVDTQTLAPFVDRDNILLMNPFGYGDGFFGAVSAMGSELAIPTLNYGSNWVGPLTIPGETACLRCAMAIPAVNEAATRWATEWSSPSRELGGVFAPRAALNCSIAVWEAAQYLGGFRKPTSAEAILMIDTFDYAPPLTQRVVRDSGCPQCGEAETHVE